MLVDPLSRFLDVCRRGRWMQDVPRPLLDKRLRDNWIPLGPLWPPLNERQSGSYLLVDALPQGSQLLVAGHSVD